MHTKAEGYLSIRPTTSGAAPGKTIIQRIPRRSAAHPPAMNIHMRLLDAGAGVKVLAVQPRKEREARAGAQAGRVSERGRQGRRDGGCLMIASNRRPKESAGCHGNVDARRAWNAASRASKSDPFLPLSSGRLDGRTVRRSDRRSDGQAGGRTSL